MWGGGRRGGEVRGGGGGGVVVCGVVVCGVVWCGVVWWWGEGGRYVGLFVLFGSFWTDIKSKGSF